MSPHDVDPAIERAAEAVADAAPLDWAGVTREHPEHSSTLEQLHALALLAEAHREARESSPAAVDDTEPVAFRWGELDVIARLGEGAFGEVWRAREPALRREVALKLRHSGAGSARWLDEARRLARVRHANVVVVHGAAEHDGRAGLWTELVRGETLEQRLAREGPFEAREVAWIGADLCRALAAVHAAGLVHGDVKPANVMRERGAGGTPGRIVLMDFGSGRESGDPGAVSATPATAAPELLAGGTPAAASDMWALGATLYRLLAGSWPYEAAGVDALRRAHESAPPSLRARRPDVPAALAAAIERALARDPAARFRDTGELEAALLASIAPAARVAARPPGPRVNGWLALAAVLAAASALAWFALRRPSAPEPLASRAAEPAPATAPTLAPTEAGAPAAAPATTAPARGALAPEVTLLRRSGAGVQPLADGGRIAVGDRLALDVRSDEPVWVYVFDEDAAGESYALFPASGLATRNPLPAGVVHRLPGPRAGKPFAWEVTSANGAETFVVVVSRRALAAADRVVAALQTPGADEPLAAAAPAEEPARGVGRMVEDDVVGGGPATRLAERLARQRDPGVWLRTIRVSNSP